MVQMIRVVGGIAVVTATPTYHPLRQLKELTGELNAIGFAGSVLFDMLAVNGLSENRFASMKFSDRKFDRSSFTLESDVNRGIKEEQDSLAKQDDTFLLGSVLSSSEIKEFTH